MDEAQQTTASRMTLEHLGDSATQADLDQFRGWVRELMAQDDLTEQDATDKLWGDGDYVANASRFGLSQ